MIVNLLLLNIINQLTINYFKYSKNLYSNNKKLSHLISLICVQFIKNWGYFTYMIFFLFLKRRNVKPSNRAGVLSETFFISKWKNSLLQKSRKRNKHQIMKWYKDCTLLIDFHLFHSFFPWNWTDICKRMIWSKVDIYLHFGTLG